MYHHNHHTLFPDWHKQCSHWRTREHVGLVRPGCIHTKATCLLPRRHKLWPQWTLVLLNPSIAPVPGPQVQGVWFLLLQCGAPGGVYIAPGSLLCILISTSGKATPFEIYVNMIVITNTGTPRTSCFTRKTCQGPQAQAPTPGLQSQAGNRRQAGEMSSAGRETWSDGDCLLACLTNKNT